MKRVFLSLAAVLITVWGATNDSSASELVLSHQFSLATLQEMPRPDVDGLRLHRQDYPPEDAVEWQVRLQAPADGSSMLYEGWRSAEFIVQFPVPEDVALHWSKGSHAEAADFQPREQRLARGEPFGLESFGGRSSDGAMPNFNLAVEGGGLIVAIGWSGDWKASFEGLGAGRVRVTAGLKRSQFRLPAGEEVRLPSVLIMSYRGNWLEGQNRFRRLMLRHFTPAGHPPMDLMPVAASVHGMIGFNSTTEENLTSLAAHIATLKLPLDTFWLDAGWTEGGFPTGQGNLNSDPARFSRGLGPVGQAASTAEMRFLAWFEPERAMRGTWLDREHPDWLLVPSGTPAELRYMENDGFRLLDLGNPEARNWALETVSNHIREGGIAVYRQDFNEYPAFFWSTDEPAEEVGLREIRHVAGLYDFLDELVRQHPGLILDNCASGGRRLDFEMMRRCVVLWRSDNCWGEKSFPRNVQAMAHGLSLWLPLHGLGAAGADEAALRSGMGACASYAINFRDPQAVANLGRHLDLYLPIRHLFAADFYPMTQWSDDPDRWLAFQFHNPEKDEGLVQAFRSATPPQENCRLKLYGLDPDKQYTMIDWDGANVPASLSGSDLMENGLEIRDLGGHGAVVLHYTSGP